MTGEWRGAETLVNKEYQFTVKKQYDVIVAGAGLAGVAAAVSAGRNGASVCLVEKTETVGGTATAGLMNLFYAPYNSLTGIGKELFERLVQKGHAVPGQTVPFDVEQCVLEMLDMLAEAHVELMLDTWVADVIRDQNTEIGLLLLNKSGFQVVLGRRMIDATGDGDVCEKAGYAYIKGRENDHMMRPMTLIFTIGGIDTERMVAYIRNHPDQFAPDPNECIVNLDIGEIRVFGYFDLVKQAKQNGDLSDKYHYFRIESVFPQTGIGTVNTIRVYHVDGTDGDDVTAAILEARKQQKELLQFMRKYIPGLENCFLVATAQSIGVRDSRRILGEYKLTETDIAEGRHFQDCIGYGKGRQVMGARGEGHSPDGNEGSESDHVIREAVAEYVEYEIPYRILIPERSTRILTAGKIVSCDILANKHLRNQPACMVTGEAAGAAAALSVRQNCDVGAVDCGALRQALGLSWVRQGEE